MYMDKKQNTHQHRNSPSREQGNRNSWPRMNPRKHRHTGSYAHMDRDEDTDMGSGGYDRGGYSYRNYSTRGKHKSRFNPGYKGGHSKRSNLHRGSWWKILVCDADKFDREHFFKMLENTTNECIDPQGIHVNHNRMIFWVKNGRAAEAIRNQSGKLTLKDHTVYLFAVSSNRPEAVLSKDELKAKICHALFKRYKDNVLDLSEFHRDPDLKNVRSRLYEAAPILGELIEEKCADLIHEIDFSGNNLYSTSCLRSVLVASKSLVRIKFENNYIKKLYELQGLKNFAPNITHLSLKDNPIKIVMEESQYISDIRKFFPRLIHLDTVPLPEKIMFESDESDVILPPTKTFSILLEVPQKSALNNFFLQYVQIFDAGTDSRKQLGPAYHETCFFSCASSWRTKWEASNNFPAKMPGDLLKRNRNFRHCTRAEVKEARLFIGRETVVEELCQMEETKHVLHTLNIDTSILINGHVTAVLSGVIETPSGYRSFSRTFILASNSTNGSFLILNDQLSVVRTNPAMAEKMESPDLAVAGPAAELAGASSDQVKTNLLKRVQDATKMVTEYCRQCLEAAGWEFDKALAIFKDMNTKGSIPAHVFLK